MALTLHYRDEAIAELVAALQYLEERRPAAIPRLQAAVTAAEQQILQFPRAWPRASDNSRRCPVRGFPYWLQYAEEDGEEVVVFAVTHGRREPGYWRGR